MLRKWVLALLIWLLCTGAVCAEEIPGGKMFIAPHPGDEVLAFGASILQATAAGEDVAVVYVTGDAAETLDALALLGVGEEDIHTLGLEAASAEAAPGLTALMQSMRPAEIYVTSRYDADDDNAAAFLMTVASARAVGEGYAPLVHETILHTNSSKWPLPLTRTQNKKLPIGKPHTEPFEDSGLPLMWKEATHVDLDNDMLLQKEAAIAATFTAGMKKADQEVLYAYLKADEFYWTRSLAQLEEAQDITLDCTLTLGGKVSKKKEMRDRDYRTHHDIKKGGVIEADSALEDITGVFLQFYDHSGVMLVEAEQDGAWVTAGETCGKYLTEYFPLPEGTRHVRITNKGKNRVMVAELTLYGEGSRPARSPQWHTLEKADMMLIVAHPDDELLWFGGMLPTYAGERDLAVQVMYLVPATPYRRLELLDGLWHCGVEAYPMFGGLRDAKAYDLKGQYGYWNRTQLLQKMIKILRQMKPEVVVTHDVNGEYGHGAHMACADVLKQAVPMAADATKYPKDAKKTGTWQVKKFYLHLWEENQVRFDWRTPLTAFGGKDGLTVATEALAFHVSQTKKGWQMEDGGPYDNALFGLQYTVVGEDTGTDLMENVE